MVIIENILGLEYGDEVGLFDANGMLNSGDCADEYGDLLVGAGIYDGEQLNIVGIGSIDFCDFPDGYQLSGWVEDNEIDVRLWAQSQNYEYTPDELTIETGGVWGELYSNGKDLNVRPGCPNQIERIESGLLSYGSDMTIRNSPFECGLGRFCEIDAI